MRHKQARKFRAYDVSARALELWNTGLEMPRAKAQTAIDIFDVIGDYGDGGVTAATISAQLKGAGDVVINVNSPGGDFFEGMTIYNLLRSHGGNVTVNILGVAASAASAIAMAGDTIRIGKSASLMIHEASALVIGNSHDFARAAEDLAGFDASLVDVYARRTGKPKTDLHKMLKDETWMDGSTAVAEGFADALLPADTIRRNTSAMSGKDILAARMRTAARDLIADMPGVSESLARLSDALTLH